LSTPQENSLEYQLGELISLPSVLPAEKYQSHEHPRYDKIPLDRLEEQDNGHTPTAAGEKYRGCWVYTPLAETANSKEYFVNNPSRG
jgi:hypothetical protein